LDQGGTTSPDFTEETGMDVSCWETAEILVSGSFIAFSLTASDIIIMKRFEK
jgi:hypothetical protein